eukprot:6886047-Ditylum_brightwellii.AAC.2
MSHLNCVVDDKNTVFEKPELTHVHGEPSIATLLTLRNEVHVSVQSVTTTLGDGRNGHLGMVMPPTDYALIPGTSIYNRPPQLTLVLPAGGIQFQITHAKEQYYDDLNLFNKCNCIKKILIQQIVDAVDSKYLTSIRDPVTHQVTLTIPEIMDYLFDNYGNVTAEEFRKLRTQVKNLTYQPIEPVDTIFTHIL